MSQTIGSLEDELDKQIHNDNMYFTEIYYRVRDGKVAYRYHYRKLESFSSSAGRPQQVWSDKWQGMRRYVGKVKGVKLFDSSPFDDVIHLNLRRNFDKDNTNVEDFAIVNHRGSNIYVLNIKNTDNDGYISMSLSIKVITCLKLN